MMMMCVLYLFCTSYFCDAKKPILREVLVMIWVVHVSFNFSWFVFFCFCLFFVWWCCGRRGKVWWQKRTSKLRVKINFFIFLSPKWKENHLLCLPLSLPSSWLNCVDARNIAYLMWSTIYFVSSTLMINFVPWSEKDSHGTHIINHFFL